jgi:hypothetical protein
MDQRGAACTHEILYGPPPLLALHLRTAGNVQLRWSLPICPEFTNESKTVTSVYRSELASDHTFCTWCSGQWVSAAEIYTGHRSICVQMLSCVYRLQFSCA